MNCKAVLSFIVGHLITWAVFKKYLLLSFFMNDPDIQIIH